MEENKSLHPCFNKDSVGKVARIHLPLIKNCNIQCNYCNRNYSCPNENRPGVTSQLITPNDVYSLLKENLELYPSLKIVGIAGPGEAFAEPEIVYQSLKIVRNHFPDMKLCLSTNGLAVIDNIDLIKELNIDYITVTVNTLNPVTASKIYHTDIETLLNKQQNGLKELVKADITTKVNSVVIPEINMEDVIDVARFAGKIGIFAQNLISFYPVKGSLFENLREPSKEEMDKLRFECSGYIKQITHCKRCRSDVVGNLSDDRKISFNKC
ncbi:MAG: hypothetical protein A2104_02005 [Candidatus Melainabacteria bacterium GWF2_32_7]|nr:MAG: hypothetical protein A2104_02005 [Candidatus Melainabacteria bacterium GWF2_32_7]